MSKLIKSVAGFVAVLPLILAVATIIRGTTGLTTIEYTFLGLTVLFSIMAVIFAFYKDFLTD